MTISMYNASVHVFKQLLSALNDILIKARDATNSETHPEALLHARLFPDMFDFTRQVQIAGIARRRDTMCTLSYSQYGE